MRPRARSFSRNKIGGPSPAARSIAFDVLSEYKDSGRFVSQLFRQMMEGTPNVPPSDRTLAAELINGVVRRRATLDAILEPHVARPRHRIEGKLWTLLQLGAYQLALLDGVPHYAAVNETVSLARQVGPRG